MPSPTLLLATAALALFAFGPVRSDPVIYAIGNLGTELLTIDGKTGEIRTIGPIGSEGSLPLAFGPDRKLYTITDSIRRENAESQLAFIDPGTGKASPIGEPFGKTIRLMALGAAPDGTLYGGGLIDKRCGSANCELEIR